MSTSNCLATMKNNNDQNVIDPKSSTDREGKTESQDLNLDEHQDEPYNEGESSVSGSAPYVTSDDDTLQNAHNVGMQLGDSDEGDGKRDELDIARDVDKAEEDLRTH